MSKADFCHVPAFLTENECADVRHHLLQMASYAAGSASFPCETTCYGGSPSIEPHDPMPPWLASVRRRIELNVGVFPCYFAAAAIVCFTESEQQTHWYTPPQTFIGALGHVAIVSIGAPCQFNSTSLASLNETTRCHSLTNGTLTIAPPGVANQRKWRFLSAAPANQSKKRKTSAVDAVTTSWHILFLPLRTDQGAALYKQAIVDMYKTFRYGARMAAIIRQPHMKLELQRHNALATRKLQLRIDEIVVKKEKN